MFLALLAAGCGARHAHVAGPENRISCAGPHTLADGANGRLQGRVSDAAGDAPLAGVDVLVQSRAASRSVATDDDGRWRIGNLPEGEYLVVMRRGQSMLYSTSLHLCPEDVQTLRTPVWIRR